VTALQQYLEGVKDVTNMEKNIETEKTAMIKSIVHERVSMAKDEKQNLEMSNAIWGIILVGFFSGTGNITEKEIELYLIKQEKSEGRDRKMTALAKKKEKRAAMVELLFACFTDWRKTAEGISVLTRHASNTAKAFSNAEVAKNHEALVDTIARMKGLTVGEKEALQAYESNVMQRMGIY
jgi:hypothetical protein